LGKFGVLLNIFRVVVLLTITFESQAEYGRQQTGVNSVVISGTFFRDFMGLLYHGIGLKVFYGKDKSNCVAIRSWYGIFFKNAGDLRVPF
jgi:hypothetical protein